MTSPTKTESHMSTEPFTREPGYEYATPRLDPTGSSEGWERFSPVDGWKPAWGKFGGYFDDIIFRRKLPAPAQDGWVKFSDRQAPKDTAVWTCENGVLGGPYSSICNHQPKPGHYWKLVDKPAPPKAPTQEEIDREAFDVVKKRYSLHLATTLQQAYLHEAFLAGVKHGRAVK